MKALSKIFILTLVSIALTSCGGGGGGSQSAFGPTPADTITITAAATSIPTSSFTTLTVTVTKNDGSPENDGTTVNASLSPTTIGTVSGSAGSVAGATATNTLSGGKTSFNFTSSNQTGTASIAISVPAGTNGSATIASQSINIAVTGGNTQDPRLQLVASTLTLPESPYTVGQEQTSPFPGNYLGSPYISEVTLTWRHSDGQLVNGTQTVNVSVAPTTVISFSTLNSTSSNSQGTSTSQFTTLLGSGPVDVTGGVGTIYVHAGNVPGTGVLTVTAIDPDNAQTISSQLTITVVGGSTGLPSSISISSQSTAVYISGSNGPQSTLVSAQVTDGSGGFVNNATGVDDVQFQIVGPANSDARLVAINAAGQQVTGTTVLTTSSNGIANVTFQTGTQQGPVQIKATADEGDNNVDNGIQDPVSATATIVVSDGKLYSLSIDSPDTGAVTSTGVAANVTEDPAGSGNYELTISAKGVDRQGNPVLPGTIVGFGDIDSPQVPSATAAPQYWFQISGTHGNPQEGGTQFTAADGHFTTAGGGAGPGDTLLVIGKASEGAPAGNDDLETSSKITAITSATSLTVATPFNLNDTTGVSVDYGSILPYIIGRATFSSVDSPVATDATTTSGVITGVATTTLNYPASAIGKAVAVWAQGTGTDTNATPNQPDIVADIATLVFPGMATGAIMTASPDPVLGNTTQQVTVCYYDGNNLPVANFDITFALSLGGTGSGSADGVPNGGLLNHLTGSNGCVTVPVVTNGLVAGTTASITFSAGTLDSGGTGSSANASVTVQFVVDVASAQVSPCQFLAAKSPPPTNQTVAITVLGANGAGVPGVNFTAACTLTSNNVSTPADAIASTTPATTTDAGTTSATITVENNSGGVVGFCTYTATVGGNSIIGTVGVNTGSCSSTGGGGFSP